MGSLSLRRWCYEIRSPYKTDLVLDSEAYGANKTPSDDRSPLEVFVMFFHNISVDDGGRTVVYLDYSSHKQESTRFEHSTLHCYDSAFSKLSGILSSMGINSIHHDNILTDGLSVWGLIPKIEIPSHMRDKEIRITVRVQCLVGRLSHKQCLDAWAASNIAIVPACRKEVEEEVKVFTDTTCCVCLEKFNKEGSEEFMATMPCSHVFHDRCIFQCIYRSPYCPLCRSNVHYLLPLPPHKFFNLTCAS